MLCICFALLSHYSFPIKRSLSSMNRCAIQCNIKHYHLSSTNDTLIFSSNILIPCLHCFPICALYLDLEHKLDFFFNQFTTSFMGSQQKCLCQRFLPVKLSMVMRKCENIVIPNSKYMIHLPQCDTCEFGVGL